MGTKPAVVLSGRALVVALLESTSAGDAAPNAVIPVPPARGLPRRYRQERGQDRRHQGESERSAGNARPLDASGKLPASVGAVGPKGDPGVPGPKGDPGPSTGAAYVACAKP